jgi:serine/threonine-protein kinase
MGEVYEAHHRALEKRVALKTLAPSLAKDDEVIARFLREGRAAARIHHPNVVGISDVDVEGDTPYLVMELLDGEDLADLLGRGGALGVEEALDIILPVLSAVSAAHEKGVIHRDLKPANIFITRSEAKNVVEPKVVDFGISKLTSGSADEGLALTKSGTILGTPYYMAPEQARGAASADARSDQYGLGVILYECLTGTLPFEESTLLALFHVIVQGQFLPPRHHRPDLPEALEAAILRAMQTDPANRFPDVASFGLALLPFASKRAAAEWRPAFERSLGLAATLEPRPIVSREGSVPVPPTRDASNDGNGYISSSSDPDVTLPRAPRGGLVVGVLAAALMVGGLGWMAMQSKPNEAVDSGAPTTADVRTFIARVSTDPSSAILILDGEEVGRGNFATELVADGVWHELSISAVGYESASVRFRDAPPPAEIVLDPIAEVDVVTTGMTTKRTTMTRPTMATQPTMTEADTGTDTETETVSHMDPNPDTGAAMGMVTPIPDPGSAILTREQQAELRRLAEERRQRIAMRRRPADAGSTRPPRMAPVDP